MIKVLLFEKKGQDVDSMMKGVVRTVIPLGRTVKGQSNTSDSPDLLVKYKSTEELTEH